MKSFVILFFVLFAVPLLGQDEQWYVLDGENKASIPVTIGESVDIINVSHPDYSFHSQSRNDVLVIYQDGSFMNTWKETITPPAGSIAASNYSIQSIGKPISYVYYTNSYEGNDPDALVVSPASSGNWNIPQLHSSHYFNHDIVAGKDLTFSLNINEFNSTNESNCQKFKLCYNQIRSGNVITDYDYLEVNEVFNNEFYYPNGITAFNSIGKKKCIDIALNNEKNVHVNFRVKEKVKELDLTDLHGYFSLSSNCLKDTIYFDEPIRLSHDPNFTSVTGVCKNAEGEYSANFHLQFQNTGDDVVNKTEASCTLPKIMDASTICISEWWLGNESGTDASNISVCVDGQKIMFDFPSTAYLAALDVQDGGPIPAFGSTVGYVKFCVKVNSKIMINEYDILTIPLELTDRRTYFDCQEYNIDDHYDPTIIIPNKPKNEIVSSRVVKRCDCACSDVNCNDPKVFKKCKKCWIFNLFD